MAGRRANGEGTVYLRQDGRWEAAAYLLTTAGTRKRVRVCAKTRIDALARLRELLSKADHGTPVPAVAWTVGGYLDYWFSQVASANRAPKTMERYGSLIEQRLKPGLGSTRLSRLSAPQLQVFFTAMIERGVGLRTVQQARTTLSAALTRAMREQLIQSNPARLVELPTWQRATITPWLPEQTADFLDKAATSFYYPVFVLLATYGMRRGEALGLRVRDVDLDNDLLHLRQQVQRVGSEVLTRGLKTKNSVRDLPLLPGVRDLLVAQLRDRGQRSRGTLGSDLMFTSSTGQPIEPGNVTRSFHEISRKAGLPKSKLHHLRHTAATLLKDQGVPDRDIQLILGHATMDTTQQLYQHGNAKIQSSGLAQVSWTLVAGRDGSRSRQNQPAKPFAFHYLQRFQSGGPGGTRTLDTLLKSSTGDTAPTTLTEVKRLARARYNARLLGAAAVMFSRQNTTRTIEGNHDHATLLENPTYLALGHVAVHP
jgi:integrase